MLKILCANLFSAINCQATITRNLLSAVTRGGSSAPRKERQKNEAEQDIDFHYSPT